MAGEEKHIVQRERASKSYRLSAYFISKVRLYLSNGVFASLAPSKERISDPCTQHAGSEGRLLPVHMSSGLFSACPFD